MHGPRPVTARRFLPICCILLVAQLAIACGEDATATVSGTVRTATGAAIAGALVESESVTATTGADGRFELQNLPVGRVTISTSAPGFDPQSEGVGLVAGSNAYDVVLTDQTIYTHGNVRAYLPLGIAEYKAAIVFLPGLKDPATGNPLDSRSLVGGTPGGSCSIWCSPAMEEVRSAPSSSPAETWHSSERRPWSTNLQATQTLLGALSALGTQSLHPELEAFRSCSSGTRWGGAPRTGSAASMAPGSPGSSP